MGKNRKTAPITVSTAAFSRATPALICTRQPSAIVLQSLLASAVLVICVLLTDSLMNINCVFGPGTKRQVFMPAWLYFVTLVLYVPLGLYLPVHLTIVRALKWTYEKPAT